jgi:hypothetical protein
MAARAFAISQRRYLSATYTFRGDDAFFLGFADFVGEQLTVFALQYAALVRRARVVGAILAVKPDTHFADRAEGIIAIDLVVDQAACLWAAALADCHEFAAAAGQLGALVDAARVGFGTLARIAFLGLR